MSSLPAPGSAGRFFPLREAAAGLLAAGAFGAALFHTGPQTLLIVVALAALGAAVLCAGHWPRRARVELVPLDIAVFALSAWLLFTVPFSDARFVSVLAYLVYALLPLGYLVMRITPASSPMHRVMLGVLLTAAAVWATVALVEAVLTGGPPSVSFANRNNLAAWFNAVLPLAAAGWLYGRAQRQPWLTWPALALVGLLATAVAVNGSRGSFIGLAVVVLLAVGGFLRARLPLRALAAPALAVVIGFAVGHAVSHGHTGQRLATFTELEVLPADGERLGPNAVRLVQWRSAIPLLTQAPVTGIGLGTTERAWAPHLDPRAASASRHLHNDFLEYAAEAGWLAPLLWFGLLAAAVAAAWRRFRADEAPGRVFSLAAVAAVAGMFAHAMFTMNLKVGALLLTAGLLLGFVAGADRATGRRAVTVGLPVRAVALAVSVVLGWQLLTVGAYAALMHDAAPRDDTAVNHATLKRLGWAMRARPDAASARINYAEWLRAGGRHLPPGSEQRHVVYTEAARHLDHAVRLDPLLARPYHDRALLRLEFLAPGTADDLIEEDLRTALARQPRMLAARYRLARLLLDRGDDDHALALLVDGLRWPYPSVLAHFDDYFALTIELAEAHSRPDVAAAARSVLEHLDRVRQRAERRAARSSGVR